MATVPDTVTEHRFGGSWTETKLDAVTYYLECYAKVLKFAGFNIWYIDAFAGTGTRISEQHVEGILGQPSHTIISILQGSAHRALEVTPRFDHAVFVEKKDERCEELK